MFIVFRHASPLVCPSIQASRNGPVAAGSHCNGNQPPAYSRPRYGGLRCRPRTRGIASSAPLRPMLQGDEARVTAPQGTGPPGRPLARRSQGAPPTNLPHSGTAAQAGWVGPPQLCRHALGSGAWPPGTPGGSMGRGLRYVRRTRRPPRGAQAPTPATTDSSAGLRPPRARGALPSTLPRRQHAQSLSLSLQSDSWA